MIKKSEPIFVNVYEAQESIPRNRFRQAGNQFLGSNVYQYGLCMVLYLFQSTSGVPSNRVISSLEGKFSTVGESIVLVIERLFMKISNLCHNHL